MYKQWSRSDNFWEGVGRLNSQRYLWERNTIEEVMTPYEKPKSLARAEAYLRLGITFEGLETIANQMSDNQFAERMVNACSNLFQQISRFVNGVA